MEEANDLEANNPKLSEENTQNNQNNEAAINSGLAPIRTEPPLSEYKRRRLDRQTELKVPEVHIIGQIIGGSNLLMDGGEGAFCRWKVDTGKTWKHLGGDLIGQTQIAYSPSSSEAQNCVFNHPIDLHFAFTGLQGWSSPRISVQSFRLDAFGRRIINGYGFLHLSLNPGLYREEINLWRPVGTPDQELRAYLLGEAPTLLNHDPIYEAAWKDRCRLLTTTAGTIYVELFTVTRFLKEQQVDNIS